MSSPWATRDSVSHVGTDQSSIVRPIERHGPFGDVPSAATLAGSITAMFDVECGHGHR